MTDLERQAERIRKKLDELQKLLDEKEALSKRWDKVNEMASLVGTEVQVERRGLTEIAEKDKTFEEVNFVELHGASVPEWPGIGEWPTSREGKKILATTRGGGTRPLFFAFTGEEEKQVVLKKLREAVEWREQVCRPLRKTAEMEGLKKGAGDLPIADLSKSQ